MGLGLGGSFVEILAEGMCTELGVSGGSSLKEEKSWSAVPSQSCCALHEVKFRVQQERRVWSIPVICGQLLYFYVLACEHCYGARILSLGPRCKHEYLPTERASEYNSP